MAADAEKGDDGGLRRMKQLAIQAAFAGVLLSASLSSGITIRSSSSVPSERVVISQPVFAPSGSDRDWRYLTETRNDRDVGQTFNAFEDLFLDAITIQVASNDPGSLNAPYRLLILGDLLYEPGEIAAGSEIVSFSVLSEQTGRLPTTAFSPLSYVTFDLDDVFLPGDAQYGFLLQFDTEASQRLVKLKASSGTVYGLGDAIERNFGTGSGDVRRGNVAIGPVTTTGTERNDLVFFIQSAVPEPGSALLASAAMMMMLRRTRRRV